MPLAASAGTMSAAGPSSAGAQQRKSSTTPIPKVNRSPESRLYLAKPDEAAKVSQLDLSGDRIHNMGISADASGGGGEASPQRHTGKLTIVPSVLERYVNLRILDLSGNKLTAVQHLERCGRLRSLDLSRNALHIFPLKLMENKQLTHLNLSGNFVSKIPRNVSLLAALVSLELSGNRLHNLPDLKHLKVRWACWGVPAMTGEHWTGRGGCGASHLLLDLLFWLQPLPSCTSIKWRLLPPLLRFGSPFG